MADKGIPENQIIAPITVAVTRGNSIEAQGKIRSVDKVKFNDSLYLYQASDNPPQIVRANRKQRRKLIHDLATIQRDKKQD